jgi:hypothetical protein
MREELITFAGGHNLEATMGIGFDPLLAQSIHHNVGAISSGKKMFPLMAIVPQEDQEARSNPPPLEALEAASRGTAIPLEAQEAQCSVWINKE